MSNDNIIDTLNNLDLNKQNEELISDEVIIPKRCSKCKTSLVCSVIPNFVSFAKIRIYITIDSCPFFQSINNEQQ